MADSVQFSEVQLLNLSFLLAIQTSIRKDPIAACYKFKLSVEQANKAAAIPTEKIQAFVANFGQECLFTVRQDLLQLLDEPPGLLRSLATVRVSPPASAGTLPLDRRHSHRS